MNSTENQDIRFQSEPQISPLGVSFSSELQSKGKIVLYLKHQLQTWFCWTFLVDWILAFLVFGCAEAIPNLFLEPFDRLYFEFDARISFPMMNNTVPSWTLPIIGAIIPLFVMLAAQLFLHKSFSAWHLHDIHHFSLSLLEALTINSLVTTPIKFYAGRYRPDFLDRLEKDDGVRDGHLSFPSGHSSVSFTGMMMVTLYLSGKMGVFNKRGGYFFKYLIAISPLALAVFVAISRTRDYRHDFSDVLAGSLIGIVAAVSGYFLNYDPLWSNNSHLPKSRKSVQLLRSSQEGIPGSFV